jgi:hypothetical protein
MTDVARKQLFLSHAGEDADFALRLARQLETEWLLQAPRSYVDVFCTSKHEHRYRDLRKTMPLGANFREEGERWEKELRQYLHQNLLTSTAYLLLVTKQSNRKSSAWIAFEIDVASEHAKQTQTFFFPCVAEGATLGDLPSKANEFQGIDLASAGAVRELVRVTSNIGSASD